MPIAIIGGTGIYHLDSLESAVEECVHTPYGDARWRRGRWQGREVIFLARHGAGHGVPPHRVNHRANIHALAHADVGQIFATSACGGLRAEWPPGSLVLPDQLIDFRGVATTFFDGDQGVAVHIDFTHPYCSRLRQRLVAAAQSQSLSVVDGATYGCSLGPRFETAAEIRFLQRAGVDLVGMTGAPEATLAREAEICYASIAIVTNFAAGISPIPLTHAEVLEVMAQAQTDVLALLSGAVEALEATDCPCRHALDGYREMVGPDFGLPADISDGDDE